jgi:hypothetical protein
VKFTKLRGSSGTGGGGSCTDGDTCPAKYATGAGTFVFVGREVTDPAERAQLGIGPGETAVEVPPEIGGPDA